MKQNLESTGEVLGVACNHSGLGYQQGMVLMGIKKQSTALGKPDDPQDRNDSRDMGVPWY